MTNETTALTFSFLPGGASRAWGRELQRAGQSRQAPTGQFVDSWGSLGDGPGQYNFPFGIAAQANGRLLVAEIFNEENKNVQISVNFSGTGGGMKKFAAGETDISNASRPIKASEAKKIKDAGIEFIELPVAYDGLTIVVNKANNHHMLPIHNL